MSDLIRRKDAVREMALMLEDISADLCEDILTRFGYDTPQELATEAMSIIPSAERKGEWEIVGRKYFRRICPFCKRPRAFRDSRFCDWCGADMRGADDGR